MNNDTRFAYFILESETDENGEFRVCCAYENEPGYKLMDWVWGNDLSHARNCAVRKNESMRLTQVDVDQIVLSTMQTPAT